MTLAVHYPELPGEAVEAVLLQDYGRADLAATVHAFLSSIRRV